MKFKRSIYINDRVKALIHLLTIMALALLIVFSGLESMKTFLPESNPHFLYIKNIRYPFFFKVLVSLIWGMIAAISAYLFVHYQYMGFAARLSIYFEEKSKNPDQKPFVFRKKDITNVCQKSMENMINFYDQELSKTKSQLIELKNKLKSI